MPEEPTQTLMATTSVTQAPCSSRDGNAMEHTRHREAFRSWQDAESKLLQPPRPQEISSQSQRVLHTVAGSAYNVQSNGIPPHCPFSIGQMNDEGSLFLIREKDQYGEYPNIYAKVVSENDRSNTFDARAASLIVLCDTGCGTNVRLKKVPTRVDLAQDWNIGTFLEATINPQNHLPYLIITSHCHYDHILGIANLDTTRSVILSSGYVKSFVTPRSHLAEHSLCNDLGISTPKYEVDIWAEDFQKVVVALPHRSRSIPTGITILQTPGHTPDSLAWYDATTSPPHIFVGDTLYERQSEYTKTAKWGREPPMPTIFNINSSLADWSRSMMKMIAFVQARNNELKTTSADAEEGDWVMISQTPERRTKPQRVMLGAAHVTVSVDAEKCLQDMMDFMHRILQDEVPHCRVEDENEHEVWLWDDLLDIGETAQAETGSEKAKFGRFSVRAPLFVIERRRERTRTSSNLDGSKRENWSVS